MNHEFLIEILSIKGCCEKPDCNLDGGFLRYCSDLNRITTNQDELVQILCGVDALLLTSAIMGNKDSFYCLLHYGLDKTHLNQFLRIVSSDDIRKLHKIISKQLIYFSYPKPRIFETLDRDIKQFYLNVRAPDLVQDESFRRNFRSHFNECISDIEIPEELQAAFNDDKLIDEDKKVQYQLDTIKQIERDRQNELKRIEVQKELDRLRNVRILDYSKMPFHKAFHAMICDNEFIPEHICETYNLAEEWPKNIDSIDEIVDLRHVKTLLTKISSDQYAEHPFALQLKAYVEIKKRNIVENYIAKKLQNEFLFGEVNYLPPYEQFQYFIDSDLQVHEYPWQILYSVTPDWCIQLKEDQSRKFMDGLRKIKSRRAKKKYNELIAFTSAVT